MNEHAHFTPSKYDSFLFMKVGDHAGEKFDAIIARKRLERENAGMIFWGYGGAACHPLTQVQPFLRTLRQQNGVPVLLMQKVASDWEQSQYPAEEYSDDGINWKKIPKGIHVTGSRYALVLGEILPGELTLDVRQFEVGIGPSRGRPAHEYLRGRTDKACLVRSAATVLGSAEPSQVKRVEFQAPMVEPFAVMLR